MASYPVSIGQRHNIRPLTRRRVDVSDAGTIRTVDLNEDTVYTIDLIHPLIPTADKNTLVSFYDTNKNSANTIALAGDTYDFTFTAAFRVESASATHFNVYATLQGTKQ